MAGLTSQRPESLSTQRTTAIGALLLAVLVGPACRRVRLTEDIPPPPPKPADRYVEPRSPFTLEDFLQIRTWLLARRFEDLDRRLQGLQEAYERGERSEQDLLDFFAMFVAADAAYGPLLEEWVRTKPDSYCAQAAFGTYQVRQAWLKRDQRWISRTSEKQLREMNHHLELSRKALEAALALRPRLIPAHVRLLECDLLGGTRRDLRVHLERGLRADPSSFELRSGYLYALSPSWHGSRVEMRQFAAEAQKWARKNPRLAALQGFVAGYVDVYDAWSRDDAQGALRSADEALTYGEQWDFLQQRAQAFVTLRRYSEAAAAAGRVLEIRPHTVEALRLRGVARWWLGDREAGLKDLELALALDPADPATLDSRARLHTEADRPEEAIDDFQKFLAARPYAASVWARKGIFLMERLDRVEDGESACRRALEIDPRDSQGLLCDALIRARKGDAGYRASLERHLEETNVADDLVQLADRLERGRGLPKDEQWAVRLFRQAADRGEPYALADIGWRTLDGIGVKQDVAKGARLVRQAAEGGEPWGMRLTGFAYDTGNGVPRDFNEARRWYERAVRGGDVHARYNLGLLYWDGRGVPPDRVVAHILLSGAATRGNTDAQSHLPELEAKMKPEELREARSRAAALPDGLPF